MSGMISLPNMGGGMNLSELLKDNEDIIYDIDPRDLTITSGKILYLRLEQNFEIQITFENGITKTLKGTTEKGYPTCFYFGAIDYVPLYRNYPSSSDKYQEYDFSFFNNEIFTSKSYYFRWGAKDFIYNHFNIPSKETQYYYSLLPLKVKNMTVKSAKEIIYIKSIY